MTNKKNLRLNGILSKIELHFIYGEYNEFFIHILFITCEMSLFDIFCQSMIFIDFFYFHDTNISIYTFL